MAMLADLVSTHAEPNLGHLFHQQVRVASERKLEIGWHSLQGEAHLNEDRVLVYSSPKYSIAAVFDGHGGCDASQFLQSHFLQVLQQNFTCELRPDSCEDLLRNCISDLEMNFNDWARWTGNRCGSCLLAALIVDDTLFIANLGDSRAVLATAPRDDAALNPVKAVRTAKALSVDHVASSIGEKQRIEDAGGFVRGGRVAGVLEPSRTIGDIDLKKKSMRGWLIAKPDVQKTPIKRGDILLLGSDGVWDVITNSSAVSLVEECVASGKGIQHASESLVKASKDLGSEDDISVVVLHWK